MLFAKWLKHSMTNFDQRFKIWRDLQVAELDAYRESYRKRGDYFGFFSVDARTDAKRIGERIAKSCNNCLDVGAGILPRPVYMRPGVKFYGIDPFFGEYPRDFPFAQAIGEYLPFPDETFECVSFMSALDHQIEPVISLREAYRVLARDGLLFLWIHLRIDNSRAYRKWRRAPPGTKFNTHHQYAFIKRDIEELFEQSGFTWVSHEYIRSPSTSVLSLIVGKKVA